MEKSLQQADAKRPPPKPASDVTTNTQTPPSDSVYGKDVKGTVLTKKKSNKAVVSSWRSAVMRIGNHLHVRAGRVA